MACFQYALLLTDGVFSFLQVGSNNSATPNFTCCAYWRVTEKEDNGAEAGTARFSLLLAPLLVQAVWHVTSLLLHLGKGSSIAGHWSSFSSCPVKNDT